MDTFDFSEALSRAKAGKTISRKAWPLNIHVNVQFPDANSANTEPYLYMEKTVVQGDGGFMKRFPLDLSCESIFADDWYEVL